MANYEKNEIVLGEVKVVLLETVKENKRYYSVKLVDYNGITLKFFYLNNSIEIAYWLSLVKKYSED